MNCDQLQSFGKEIKVEYGKYIAEPYNFDGDWVRISDSDIQPVKFDRVQRAKAYMLFYEKKDP